MGFFRSPGRKKVEARNDGIQRPTSFDTMSRDDNKSIDGSDQRTKAQRFNFLKVKRVFGGMTPDTISATPSTSSAGVDNGSNNRIVRLVSPDSIKSSRLENETQPTGEEMSSASLSSMLDTLKILAISDKHIESPKNSSTYQDVEVMTPESRYLLLQQREVIRKILFDKNTETNDVCNVSEDDDVYVDDLADQIEDDEEYLDDDGDEYSNDDSDRDPSPPPPPPLDDPEEKDSFELEHDNLPSQDLTILGTSNHSAAEIVSVRTGPNASQQMKITVTSSHRSMSTPGQTPDRSMMIERPTVATPLTELTPAKTSVPTQSYQRTDSKGLPEDENHYYEMLRGNFESPIPDDERMEYTKDEMLEAPRSISSVGKLNVVELRERELTGLKIAKEIPSSESELGSRAGLGVPGKTIVEISNGVDKKLFKPISKLQVEADMNENTDPRIIGNKKQTSNTRGTISGDRVAYNTKYDSNNTTAYLCDVANPNAVTQNIIQALNCGGSSGNAVDNKYQQLGAMGILQEKVKNRWNVSSKMSMSYGADNNSVVVKNAPSFVYSSADENTDRFLRRVTNYGFVLLFLQAPGSLGNPKEDWNGRTVTMTVEKGVIPSYPLRTPLSASWSSRTGSYNSVSSIKSMTPPIVKHPRLQWMSVAGGLTTGVLTTSVDLLNIQAVSAFGDDSNKDLTIENGPSAGIETTNELCFFTVTTSDGIVHMFEATSRDERDRIVKGLRCIIARLSFHLISGNPLSVSELYCTPPVHQNNDTGSPKRPTMTTTTTTKTSEMLSNSRQTLPSNPVQSDISRLTEEVQSEGQSLKIYETPNPSDIMDRVAHVFLDI